MRFRLQFFRCLQRGLASAALLYFGALAHSSLNAQTNLTPYLTLGVNRESDPTVYRGWPILITLQIIRSDAWTRTKETNILTLAPGPGGWNVSLKIGVNADPALTWPFELVGDTNAAVNIDPGGTAEFGWWIHPEQSATLPLGTYELRAELDTRNSATGWIGKTNSQLSRIRIEDEPATLSDELVAEKQITFAYHAFWSGETNEARNILNDLLTEQPTNITALSMRGDIAATVGDFTEALEYRSRALQQFYLAHPDSSEQPIELVQKHRAALAKATSSGPIIIIVRRNGADLLLEWNGAANEIFRIESSTDLQNWQTFRSGITSPSATFQSSVPASGAMQFLRIAR